MSDSNGNPPKKTATKKPKKKSKKAGFDPMWAKAKDVCRLNQQDIEMAKKLGMSPKSLMKNVPAPTQLWKAPVKTWIRDLYEKRFGGKPPSPTHVALPKPKKGDAAVKSKHPDVSQLGHAESTTVALPASDDAETAT